MEAFVGLGPKEFRRVHQALGVPPLKEEQNKLVKEENEIKKYGGK